MTATDVLVLGAGPAGLGSAIAAAGQGASTLVLDAMPRPGGAYWMQPPANISSGAQAQEGARRIAQALTLGVRFALGAEVIACDGPSRLEVLRDGRIERYETRALVVAAGATDRPVAFPGWDLPGVMTAAAAQRLLKLSGTLPGRRVAVAGTGPFLLLVASQLAQAGAEVVAVAEIVRPGAAFLRLLGHPERLGEAASILAPLLHRRVLRTRTRVRRALGRDHVESIDLEGPDGTTRIDDIDALVVGWGLQPRTEITRHLGCTHRYDPSFGGWACVADPSTGSTSIPGVFVAGETAGVRGAAVAWREGQLVGSAAAAFLGYRRPAAVRGLARARSFAATVADLWSPPSGLDDLIEPTTLLCRCEAVTAAEVDGAIEDGARTVSAVKRWTRCGMGPCQGRICNRLVADRLAMVAGVDAATAGLNAPRFPLVPLPLSAQRPGSSQ
ncbi:MAG: FAD-dependent oxidoreductase [Geminicoccaceae bacterium]